MKRVDYPACAERALAYIRKQANSGAPTPTGQQIAQACDFSARDSTPVIAILEFANSVVVERYKDGNTIKRYVVLEGGVEKATMERVVGHAKVHAHYNDWGGGPIARMLDRVKAEALINDVFFGRLSEVDAQKMVFKRISDGG